MSQRPLVLYLETHGNLVEARVQSASDPDEEHVASFELRLDEPICSCKGNQLGDAFCHHLDEVLNLLDKEDLVELLKHGIKGAEA